MTMITPTPPHTRNNTQKQPGPSPAAYPQRRTTPPPPPSAASCAWGLMYVPMLYSICVVPVPYTPRFNQLINQPKRPQRLTQGRGHDTDDDDDHMPSSRSSSSSSSRSASGAASVRFISARVYDFSFFSFTHTHIHAPRPPFPFHRQNTTAARRPTS